jgi:hypothetical protein
MHNYGSRKEKEKDKDKNGRKLIGQSVKFSCG